MKPSRFSLRARIFLFFCLLAFGGVAITAGGLMAGYYRVGDPVAFDGFVFSGIVIGFLGLALTTVVWLLFDENVAKPIERIAADMRTRAHAGVTGDMDLHSARYLGDLAPAAAAVVAQASDGATATADAVTTATAKLDAERQRLTALLTDIPLAIVIVNPAHQIVLYDGQAASVLAQMAHPRLNASLFDYLQEDAIRAAYDRLVQTGDETTCSALGVNGAQSYELRLKALGESSGYMLIFDDAYVRLASDAERPLVYDFDLLDAAISAASEDKALDDLCFVVFDTETTGLLPHKDEVVQIGAVRVVRGQIVSGEVLDTLVNPGIPIPPGATQVHRISDDMVQDAPGIAEAGRSFHDFARDAVIVAHNAPFDMAFLHRHAERMGVAWDHPILDTVLLSAVVYGTSETHTLDALCDRLEVNVPPDLRHTALGDAQVTAEVLCRLLPLLKARGLRDFGDVIAETRKHGRLLEDLN